jgi:hypothetical protein
MVIYDSVLMGGLSFRAERVESWGRSLATRADGYVPQHDKHV